MCRRNSCSTKACFSLPLSSAAECTCTEPAGPFFGRLVTSDFCRPLPVCMRISTTPGAGSATACSMSATVSFAASSTPVITTMRSSANREGLSSSASSPTLNSEVFRMSTGRSLIPARVRVAATICCRARSARNPSVPTMRFTGAGVELPPVLPAALPAMTTII